MNFIPFVTVENGTFPDKPHNVPLSWSNVGFASMFIMINGIISMWLGLHLEKSLFISSIRCVLQLTVMGLVLEDVLKAQHPLIVIAMVTALTLLGANEVVFNKNRRRHTGMFLSVLVSLVSSTFIIGIIGSRFALAQTPFWEPQVFIPTMGMLIGNCMSAIAVGNAYALEQFSGQKEKIEMYLAFGASRWEAGRPVAVEAVKLAMLPTINSMSIIGLISIPGMMTGQIIGGAPISDAVKYQQIIMFMISSSTAIGVLISILVCVFTCIDNLHRLRMERITTANPWLYAKKNELIIIVKSIVYYPLKRIIKYSNDTNDNNENRVLLNRH